MTGLYRALIRRSITLIIVLFAILVVTVYLLGEPMDKIRRENIRQEVMNSIINSNIKFESPEVRQQYLGEQIQLRINSVGLDEPPYSPKRFFNTIFEVMVLDLGRSYFFTSDNGSSLVQDIIAERIPRTLLLFGSATIITFIIGLYLGPHLADKFGSRSDKTNIFLAMFSYSLPTWWVGMLMIFAFAFVLPVFPARSTPSSSPSDPFYIIDLLYHMMLPLITLVLLSIPVQAYFVRLFVVNILEEDFIKAKRAIGIPKKKILYSHALRNAAPPLLNSIILGLASSFGGALLTETAFDWPGIGSLLFKAITFMDMPLLIGLIYVSSLIFIIAVIITDISYSFFDPRVRAIG
jgi:peptide/nickel transport system permease protein